MFDALRLSTSPKKFHIIVSNPPYIAANELNSLMDDVRCYEPKGALLDTKSDSADGLGFYCSIVREAANYLEHDGLLAVEVGMGQSGAVRELLTESRWRDIDTVADYGGIERVVLGRPAND